MKEKQNISRKWIWIILAVAIIAVTGFGIGYFSLKKSHDEAVKTFQTAADDVSKKNTELDHAVSAAQSILDSGEQPLDAAMSANLQTALSAAQSVKRAVPALPEKLNDIKSETRKLKEPPDYSSVISGIQEAQTALQNSIQQRKQVTNPPEDFVLQRLQTIPDISGMQAVTEDHDPNGNLNKQGGYTSCIYFSSTLINPDEVYGADLVDKGTEAGGCIEVYVSPEEAESRNTYLSAFDGPGLLNPGSHQVIGTIVVRTSSRLTASDQTNLTNLIMNALTQIQA